jgi:hypothetical protein
MDERMSRASAELVLIGPLMRRARPTFPTPALQIGSSTATDTHSSDESRCKILPTRQDSGAHGDCVVLCAAQTQAAAPRPSPLGVPPGTAGRRDEGQEVHEAKDRAEEDRRKHYYGE